MSPCPPVLLGQSSQISSCQTDEDVAARVRCFTDFSTLVATEDFLFSKHEVLKPTSGSSVAFSDSYTN